MTWGAGTCLRVYEHYGVNYKFMLDVDPKCTVDSGCRLFIASVQTGVVQVSLLCFLADYKFVPRDVLTAFTLIVSGTWPSRSSFSAGLARLSVESIVGLLRTILGMLQGMHSSSQHWQVLRFSFGVRTAFAVPSRLTMFQLNLCNVIQTWKTVSRLALRLTLSKPSTVTVYGIM